MNFREWLLQKTVVYKGFKRLVSPSDLAPHLVEQFLHLEDGKSVLDLGCGYGDLAQHFADRCTYLGIDSNEAYVSQARKINRQNDANFLVADITSPEVLQLGPFDLVVLSGVLHHLSNDQMSNIVLATKKLISKSGRLVAIEPVFAADQKLSARLLIAADRGRYVRDLDGYSSILSKGFTSINGQVVHGLLRIPYSHAILTCSSPDN